jgi:excinuclease ABC subunit A
MDIQEGIEFFKTIKDRSAEKIVEKLQPLADVGLGYLKMGQSSSSLSGGEAQRVKLASFLIKSNEQQNTLFIFDEPTTGLHFYDIEKLLIAFQRLVDKGNSLIVIEHNLDIIKCADWAIDLGTEGGEQGGHIVFEGKPEELAKCKESYTGKYLKEVLDL